MRREIRQRREGMIQTGERVLGLVTWYLYQAAVTHSCLSGKRGGGYGKSGTGRERRDGD